MKSGSILFESTPSLILTTFTLAGGEEVGHGVGAFVAGMIQTR